MPLTWSDLTLPPINLLSLPAWQVSLKHNLEITMPEVREERQIKTIITLNEQETAWLVEYLTQTNRDDTKEDVNMKIAFWDALTHPRVKESI